MRAGGQQGRPAVGQRGAQAFPSACGPGPAGMAARCCATLSTIRWSIASVRRTRPGRRRSDRRPGGRFQRLGFRPVSQAASPAGPRRAEGRAGRGPRPRQDPRGRRRSRLGRRPRKSCRNSSADSAECGLANLMAANHEVTGLRQRQVPETRVSPSPARCDRSGPVPSPPGPSVIVVPTPPNAPTNQSPTRRRIMLASICGNGVHGNPISRIRRDAPGRSKSAAGNGGSPSCSLLDANSLCLPRASSFNPIGELAESPRLCRKAPSRSSPDVSIKQHDVAVARLPVTTRGTGRLERGGINPDLGSTHQVS